MKYASAVAPFRQPFPAIARIVFATDFSNCSKAATPYACALARMFGAHLHVLNVCGPEPLVGPMGVPYIDPEQEDESARRELRAVTECPSFKSVENHYSVRRGDIAQVICRVVEEDKIDLLVVGTHGRHGVKQFVMGSIAESLFRQASCPVLTIGPGVRQQLSATPRFSRILVATDLSPASANVVEYAENMARANDGSLLLFHAIRDTLGIEDTCFDDNISAAKKRLAELMPKTLLNVDTAIKIGRPAETIVQTASERESDLIVIGARRGPRLAAHIPWAVAHEVVCAAPCPVLTIGH